ncbi:ABC transporter permease [Paenibacillus kobensis]|uniref:ABC transporter permease n=1 Tax=Paenibacillus kobensis TaxID=59841 RepID=UPI000FD7ED5B|nr:ABC-2 family transporter protein [Paenibacillus kobensis]
MRVYLKVAKQSFQQKLSYKLEYYLGLFGSILSIFITSAIWKAVYGSEAVVSDVTQTQAVSYALLAILMRTTLTMNEFLIDGKIRSGEIATELIRPYKFLVYIFSRVTGEVGYNMWTRILPLIIVSALCFNLEITNSWIHMIEFACSLVLSYFLLFYINLIFWLLAFWVHQTWSLITIKNAIILLLSGATIPFWFLPDWLTRILQLLPFKDIYFTPLTIILGKSISADVWRLYGEQLLWIALFAIISLLLWRKAQTKLVIQGG